MSTRTSQTINGVEVRIFSTGKANKVAFIFATFRSGEIK